MVKKLVSKAEFARLAGVTGQAITKAIGSGLNAAMEGKRINVNHEAAQKYLGTRCPEEVPATGLDPLYEDAVSCCRENGRYTVSNVQRKLKIGHARASRIFTMMEAARTNKPPEPGKPNPRGYAAKNNSKKAAALQNLVAKGEHETQTYDIPEDVGAFIDWTIGDILKRFGTDTAFCDYLKATQIIEAINEKRIKNAVSRGELVSRQLMKVGVIEPIDAAHIRLLTDGAKTIARRTTAMHGAGKPLEEIEDFVKDQLSSFIRPVKARVVRAMKNA